MRESKKKRKNMEKMPLGLLYFKITIKEWIEPMIEWSGIQHFQ